MAKYDLSCVIDPILALSKYGPDITRQLSSILNLWVSRELWNILNDTDFYLNNLAKLVPQNVSHPLFGRGYTTSLAGLTQSLKIWEEIRSASDLNGLQFFWIGDSLKNSLFPERDYLLVEKWERLTSTLDVEIGNNHADNNALIFACRDAISLLATIQTSFILSYQDENEYLNGHPPKICKFLESLNISCRSIVLEDAFASIETDNLRQVLTLANLAQYKWCGIHFCVIFMVLPLTRTQISMGIDNNYPTASQSVSIRPAVDETLDIWREASVFWLKI
ncbi:hypothetical protein N836_33210 [Leptolyngbya sp. Heron Island J]|uniref:hypothetical protein n=1 Tax=Leptolyngbya sp. Heron Island J TaxID=1385935 RepID=UPI0003B9724A|nr:hypothetical protein [Leptolyngbya sp. Heron Island J]ESA38290.1 hypothetical protein N836_33210 [Leptolyngbya sp. Heron Island J]